MFAARTAIFTSGKPLPGSYYFDGAGDYLSIPIGTGATLAPGPTNYTIEMWVRPQTTSDQIWYGTPGGTFRNGIAFGMRWGYMWWLSGDGNQWTFERNVGTALTLNQWSHVAITRNNWLARLYVNGTSIDSLYDYNNLGQGPTEWTLGQYAGGYNLTGHISNFRVVKGTALYTGTSFTVPTEPLAIYDSPFYGTSLLTCQSRTSIKDHGSYSVALTAVGNVAPSSLNPFNVP